MSVLFEPVRIGQIELKNRLNLAPVQQLHQCGRGWSIVPG